MEGCHHRSSSFLCGKGEVGGTSFGQSGGGKWGSVVLYFFSWILARQMLGKLIAIAASFENPGVLDGAFPVRLGVPLGSSYKDWNGDRNHRLPFVSPFLLSCITRGVRKSWKTKGVAGKLVRFASQGLAEDRGFATGSEF